MWSHSEKNRQLIWEWIMTDVSDDCYWVWRCLLPVSYTHLDVYKRQLCTNFRYFLKEPSCSIIEPVMQKQEVKVCEWFAEKRADCSSDTGAVSYTHLDVYKRQEFDRAWAFHCKRICAENGGKDYSGSKWIVVPNCNWVGDNFLELSGFTGEFFVV